MRVADRLVKRTLVSKVRYGELLGFGPYIDGYEHRHRLNTDSRKYDPWDKLRTDSLQCYPFTDRKCYMHYDIDNPTTNMASYKNWFLKFPSSDYVALWDNNTHTNQANIRPVELLE